MGRWNLQIAAMVGVPSVLSALPAWSGPVDVAINPSPQQFTDTCQAYSMALAMAFHPRSPFKANSAVELREMEQRLRASILASAQQHHRTEPIRDDWKAAIEAQSNGVLSLAWKEYDHLDPAMRFVADQTGNSNPSSLGLTLAVALVRTPVMLSFTRVASSSYGSSHIVTAFGVDLPPASLNDTAHPKLLLVNSAVKYPAGQKNVCAAEALSDSDPYRAVATLTSDYALRLFPTHPYLVTYVIAAP